MREKYKKMISDFIKRADPGFSYISVPLIKTATGEEIGLPITLIRGNQHGHIFYVGATIHGDEFNGVGIMLRVLQAIDPRELRGILVFVPVQNPVGLLHRQHFIPGNLYDTYNVDVHVNLPGSPTGHLTERTANAIFETIMCADYALDLHSSMPEGKYIAHAFCPSSKGGENANKARTLAEIFGAPIVVEMESGLYVAENMLHSVTTKQGVPTFGAEIGGGGYIDSESVETGYRGIMNVLCYLDMIDGEVSKNPDQVIVDRVVAVRTSTAGFLRHSVELGTTVLEGEELAKVYDIHLRVMEVIRSPASGIVYRHRLYPSVNADERAAMIAVPKNAS